MHTVHAHNHATNHQNNLDDRLNTQQSVQDFTRPIAELTVGTVHHNFEVIDVQELSELNGYAYIFTHKPSKARALWIACADNNKSFTIGFKTPPTDSTGVFHILEHSVLCGSQKYRVKEPFVHLLKTSMQTFLNAMTFPDKTIYPVSSTNQKDLMNLTDIYLDAVLHPNIYHEPHIFEQEGWHLEAQDSQSPFSYNGVVLNEMRGSLSNPDTMAYHKLNEALFPDTCYKYVSGGDINHIPDLSYEAFLDAHARHYKLDNSYTILYGNLSIDAMLNKINEHFMHADERTQQAPNKLELQKSVTPKLTQFTMKTTPDNAVINLGYVIGTYQDRNRVLAASIISDVLCSTNESPLKKAVLDAGLGSDVSCAVVDGCLQPQLIFQLKGARPQSAHKFRELIETKCAQYAQTGLDKARIQAALSQTEFILREGDWDNYSDGVAISIQALNGWLYNDAAALDYLRYQQGIDEMKAGLEHGYFEKLLESIVCKSTHNAEVELIAVADMDTTEEQKLQKLKDVSSDEEIERLIAHTQELKRLQETPDSPDALATLPQLHVSDIDAAPKETPVQLEQHHNISYLYHDIATHQIAYLYAYFDLSCIEYRDMCYVGILQEVLGKLSTSTYSADELDVACERKLGECSAFCSIYHNFNDLSKVYPYFVVHASALSENINHLIELPSDIWTNTQFSELDKIKSLLTQRKISMEQGFISSGHACVSERLASKRIPSAALVDQIEGVSHYMFLKELLDNWESSKQSVAKKLSQLAQTLFTANNVQVSFTGSKDDYQRFISHRMQFVGEGSPNASEEHGSKNVLSIPALHPQNEAFIIPSHVNFVGADCADVHFDAQTIGASLISARVLSLDYLWNNVRVLSGAYGCGFTRTAYGYSRFWSYRDPSIDTTLTTYAKSFEWLRAWNPTQSELEGYIVSCTASLDAPIKPYAQARRQDSEILSHKPQNWQEMIRASQLTCTSKDIHDLATKWVDDAQNMNVCVFGSQESVDTSDVVFDKVVKLIDA